MTYAHRIVNPFFQRRRQATRPTPTPRASIPRYAKLPRSPINASPVPRLTSLYHHAERGPYGDARYPGNCSGEIIKDLLIYFGAKSCFDPMTGSGTCADVCRELGIRCVSFDMRFGRDACDPANLPEERFPFVWIHPPYWRQKLYTNDPRDLSRQPTLRGFLERYEALLRNCAEALQPGGILAVLMGDYSDAETGFVPLTYHTKEIAFRLCLKQHGTDIIRFSHGASSSHKVYRSKFIPGLHDVCMLFERR
jgi:hypothetical protein